MSTVSSPQHIAHQGWDIELKPGEEPESDEVAPCALIRKHGELRCTFLAAEDGQEELDSLLRLATQWVDAQGTRRQVH